MEVRAATVGCGVSGKDARPRLSRGNRGMRDLDRFDGDESKRKKQIEAAMASVRQHGRSRWQGRWWMRTRTRMEVDGEVTLRLRDGDGDGVGDDGEIGDD